MSKFYKILFFLLILILPFQTRWIFFDHLLNQQVWEYGRLSLYLSMLFLFLLSSFYFKDFVSKFKKNFWKNKKLVSFLLLLIYLLFISIFSPLPDVSFYLISFLLGAALFWQVLQRTEKKLIYTSLIFSGVVQSVLAILQTLQQTVFANKFLGIAEHLPETLGTSVVEFGLDRILRAYGSFPHPNILGGFLVLSVLAGIWWWIFIYHQAKEVSWRGPKMKFLLLKLLLVLVSLLLIIFALLLTFSRSAILALVLALVFILIKAWRQKQRLKFQVAAKAIILFLILVWQVSILFPGVWTARFLGTERLEQKSINERISSVSQIDWRNYSELFFGQGLGLNTYRYLNSEQAPYEVQPIHNFFLLVLAEIGVLGFLLLFNLAWQLLDRNYLNLFNPWILALLVLAFFDHYLWTSWSGWLMLSLFLTKK
ncbi:O-antigen ligase family protein [Candidatus Nomurabacteria bacterium]|nr:O-antigen ligase family protein [Candidatus Nomurabacteria bacterium]